MNYSLRHIMRRNAISLLCLVALLSFMSISLLSLSSAEFGTGNHWIKSQSTAFAIAWAAALSIFFFTHPWKWRLMPYAIFASGVIGLASLFVFGVKVAGHQSWIRLGPLSFQPSEWAKVALIVMLSFRLAAREKEERHWGRALLEMTLFVAIMAGLVIAQKDLGTMLLLASNLGACLLLYPFPKKLLIIILLLFSVTAVTSYKFLLSPYQKARVQTFLHPEENQRGSGYQVTQAKITVGSGELWGKGFQKGKHHQLHYLPARHSDFVFCVWAEEWGFAGTSVLLSLYAILLASFYYCARHASYREAYFIAMLAFAHLLAHIAVNLGGVLGLLPLTGVPLPLVSYGGSALISNFILFALVLAGLRAPPRLNQAPVKTLGFY